MRGSVHPGRPQTARIGPREAAIGYGDRTGRERRGWGKRVLATSRRSDAAHALEADFDVAATPGAAARWCERYTRRHSENFTVVSSFLPARLRPSMYTIYAFCRFTDDLGDEGPEATAGAQRLALLDDWEAETDRAFAAAGGAGPAIRSAWPGAGRAKRRSPPSPSAA